MTTRIKVLVVDDAVAVRMAVSSVLSQDPAIGAVHRAENGRVALSMLPSVNPDVVVLDIEMPELDGIETLRAIRRSHPRLPVIMFSSLTQRGALATVEALTLGASDYVTKPTASSPEQAIRIIRDDLLPRILAVGKRNRGAPVPVSSRPLVAATRPWPGPARAIAIAASTGGPNALASLLTALPPSVTAPILIVQHMPPLFTKMLAGRLRTASGRNVEEATDGAPVEPGTVWVAPGGFHMTVARGVRGPVIRLDQSPPIGSLRPAADLLLASAGPIFAKAMLAVILTGMGNDGVRGCAQVRAAGGFVIVQDEASSVVWGMPGAVVRDGHADLIAPLDRISREIADRSIGSPLRSPAVQARGAR